MSTSTGCRKDILEVRPIQRSIRLISNQEKVKERVNHLYPNKIQSTDTQPVKKFVMDEACSSPLGVGATLYVDY